MKILYILLPIITSFHIILNIIFYSSISETLRKYPPIATVIKLSSDQNSDNIDCYLGKNILIFQSILGIHRDPKNYTKPEAFDPDRFREERPFVKNIFTPFGLGPKNQLCKYIF